MLAADGYGIVSVLCGSFFGPLSVFLTVNVLIGFNRLRVNVLTLLSISFTFYSISLKVSDC